MGRFTFRLEKVKEHRQRQVDRCSLAVAQATGRLDQVCKMKSRLLEDIRLQGEAMTDRREGEMNSREFLAGTSWLHHLHGQAESLDQMMAQALEHVEQARQNLAVAWRDLEVLTRLRVRQETDWRLEQDRRERREMDEVGQLQANAVLAAKIAY